MSGQSRDDRSLRKWDLVEIPALDYREAWELQLALVEAKAGGGAVPDVLILLEHPSVFTLGRRGSRDHLMVPEGFLRQRGIPIFHVERGGDITYHGPGQLVGYPVVDLRANGWKVVDFVGALEEILIRTVRGWEVQAQRNPVNRGIWVGPAKLASLGIAVRRGISFHGFALNVNTRLEPFQWINPCGLTGVTMTSMEQLLGKELPMEDVREAVKQHVQIVFGIDLQRVPLQTLQGYTRAIVHELEHAT
jgi:lipoyl(octanoyl) transferase